MKNKCDTCVHFKHKEIGDRGALYGVCELNNEQIHDYKVYGWTHMASHNHCGKGKYEPYQKGGKE